MKNTRYLAIAMAAALSLTCLVGCGAETETKTGEDTEVEYTGPEAGNADDKSINAESNGTASSFSFAVLVDDTQLNLPISYSEFLKLGFKPMWDSEDQSSQMNSYMETTLSTGETTNMLSQSSSLDGVFTNGKTSNITIQLQNTSNENLAIEDCMVVGVSLVPEDSVTGIKMGDVQILYIPTNESVKIGKSTKDQVVAKFGAHNVYDNDRTMSYYPDANNDDTLDASDIDEKHMLSLDCNKSGKITGFTFVNMITEETTATEEEK